jgi:hypothetical protein
MTEPGTYREEHKLQVSISARMDPMKLVVVLRELKQDRSRQNGKSKRMGSS